MKQAGDFSGVIGELVAGQWHDPHTGAKQTIPVKSIVIADSLEGAEADLVHRVHPGKSLCIVSDHWTRAALGGRGAEAAALSPGRAEALAGLWPILGASLEITGAQIKTILGREFIGRARRSGELSTGSCHQVMCPSGRIVKGHRLSGGNSDARRAGKTACAQAERGASATRSSTA